MAKQQNPTQANDALLQALSGGFRSPYAGQEQLFGQAATDAQAGADAWKNSYDNSQGWGTKHPRLTLGLGTLGGALIGAPQLGLMLYGQGKQNEAARKQAAVNGYQEWFKNQIENQKNLDPSSQTRYQTQDAQALFDEAKRRGELDIHTPDLYPRSLPSINADGTTKSAVNQGVPNYSREYLDQRLKGTFGGSDINYLRQLQDTDTARQYKAPSGMLVGDGEQDNAIKGQITDGPKWESGVPQPTYVADPQTIMQQLTSARNNALTQGQGRYEFDQQAPDRLATRNENIARTGLIGQQTRTEKATADTQPQYRKAQIRSLDYHPPVFGPQPSWQEKQFNMLSPEQKAQYLQNASAPQASADTSGYTKGEQQMYTLLKDQVTNAAKVYGEGSDQAKQALTNFQKFDLRSQVIGDRSNVRRPGSATRSSTQPSGSKAKFLKAAQGG